MRRINKALLVAFCFMGIIGAQAQEDTRKPYPDTLVLETDSKMEMIFSFYEMKDHQAYMTNDLWKSILSVMQSAIETSTKEEGIEVSYRKVMEEDSETAKIEVKSLASDADVFLIESDGMKESLADRIEFRIFQPKVAIFFSIKNLEELTQIKETNIESVWEQVEQKYRNYGRRDIYRGGGVIKYGNANIDEITSKPLATDQIELSMGVGLGFYRDRFIPDLGYKIGFNLPDRYGVIHIRTGLLYTQQFIFSRGGEQAIAKPEINGFLSGFFNLKYGGGNEVGVGLGYLIHSQGDFYTGDTYKFSLYNQRNDSRISFSPEIIFSNDFKQIFPALRFGLSF